MRTWQRVILGLHTETVVPGLQITSQVQPSGWKCMHCTHILVGVCAKTEGETLAFTSRDQNPFPYLKKFSTDKAIKVTGTG